MPRVYPLYDFPNIDHDERNGAHMDQADQRIEVTPNGPYLVFGRVPVTRRHPVYSEHQEPMTWETTDSLRTGDQIALCRCGGSSHKPYCDGTHQTNGFDGTESAPADSYDQRARTYQARGITVRDDRSICEHAGFCGNRMSNVWKMVEDTSDSVVRAQIMSMIERCPSGALTYRIEGEDRDVEPGFGIGVAVTSDGPYFVSGGLPVTRADGQPLESRNRMTLCRCGQSSTKPLCDGSHKEIGFRDPV
jgi:CDGSH-type Zn-finger protein